MQILDLSHTIEPTMPLYLGTPSPSFQPIASIAHDGFAEQLLTFSSHTGTHVDAPSHLFKQGATVEAMDVSRFVGRAVVLDVRSLLGEEIGLELLLPHEALVRECQFVLLYTGWSCFWGKEAYFGHYPCLSLEAAQWLTSMELHGIGVDALSVDSADSHELPIHRILLERGMVIVENLRGLEPLLHQRFLFSALPLKLAGGEASPVRAIAKVDGVF
uniref:Kynurenine formamidase n=1 Tax=Chlorobium chlorochromatii (strain CaD3) TaxID=340177 RepID=Q3AP91_CHLCH